MVVLAGSMLASTRGYGQGSGQDGPLPSPSSLEQATPNIRDRSRGDAPVASPKIDRYLLVEDFTADTMSQGEVKLGTDFQVGLTGKVMVGTDLVAAAIGASTLEGKWQFWQNREHALALGVRATYLNRETAFWGLAGSIKDHYETLDARVIRPQISWTNIVSPRLKLHTFWAKGFGRVHAKLSEKGRRELWEKKHPNAVYEDRDPDTQKPRSPSTGPTPTSGEVTDNQEKGTQESSPTQQTVQVQSITGLAQERFQLTGEFTRASGNKVLVTSRIEQTFFEGLKTSFFRLTAAHQWIWPSFQMRLGIGAQYFVMAGKDLDDERVQQSGVEPASDIAFYWRF